MGSAACGVLGTNVANVTNVNSGACKAKVVVFLLEE